MLRSLLELKGYHLRAVDGNIGKVSDFYFDDQGWVVRYLVVDTGGWLYDRRVLISPDETEKPNWEKQTLPVHLSKQQVKASPDIETELPISRQQEKQLTSYYGWTTYWLFGAAIANPAGGDNREPPPRLKPGEPEPHLRSAREVAGYHIEASDGQIGHLEDYIIATGSWIVRYLVIDTRNWLPGRKVLISPSWVTHLDWNQSAISIDLPKDQIKESPPYDPTDPVNREYEEKLFDYYGRPKYW